MAKLAIYNSTPSNQDVDAPITNAPRVLPDLTSKETGIQTVPKPNVSAQPADPSAIAMAEILKHDEEFIVEAEQVMEAPEKVKRGSIMLLQHFLRLYPGDKDTKPMALFPVVGSEQEPGRNSPYDIRKIRQLKTDGDVKIVDRSWYQDYVEQFLEAFPDSDRPLYHVQQADFAEQEPPVGIYKHLAGNPSELKAIRTRWRSRANNLLSQVKKAVKVHHQMERINQMKLVSCDFARIRAVDPTDKTKTYMVLTTTNEPIKVQDRYAQAVTDIKQYGIGAFLALDADKAEENGGTFQALLATAKRGSDEKKPEEGVDTNLINTVAKFETAIAQVAHYLEQDKSEAMVLKAMNGKDKKDNERLIETIGDVCMAFDNIWTKIETEYKAIKIAKRNKDRAAA